MPTSPAPRSVPDGGGERFRPVSACLHTFNYVDLRSSSSYRTLLARELHLLAADRREVLRAPAGDVVGPEVGQLDELSAHSVACSRSADLDHRRAPGVGLPGPGRGGLQTYRPAAGPACRGHGRAPTRTHRGVAGGDLGKGARLAAQQRAWICLEDEAGQTFAPGPGPGATGHTPVVQVSDKGSADSRRLGCWAIAAVPPAPVLQAGCASRATRPLVVSDVDGTSDADRLGERHPIDV
jgi:hypothetical protein